VDLLSEKQLLHYHTLVTTTEKSTKQYRLIEFQPPGEVENNRKHPSLPEENRKSIFK
jgi:hypothetical protein